MTVITTHYWDYPTQGNFHFKLRHKGPGYTEVWVPGVTEPILVTQEFPLDVAIGGYNPPIKKIETVRVWEGL